LPVLVAIGWILMVWNAPSALAQCQHFSVSADPQFANEGQTVTVTVSRDGAIGPSNVDVSTIDESAKAGADYTKLSKTVSFSTDTSQSFPVPIATHSTPEGDRTFRLHLSNPGGCTVNTDYQLDGDVRVFIHGNGVTTTTTAAPTTTTRPPTTTISTTRPSTTAATTATSTTAH